MRLIIHDDVHKVSHTLGSLELALSLLIPRPATAEADGRESRELEDVR